MRAINLQHPLQARRWLRLLQEDKDSGIRLRPNITASSADLGFSYKANPLGLHGPANEDADQVILGTSFALGIAVNEGENWFDASLASDQWLNLGMPVGIREWSALARIHHRGEPRFALLIYHPNIWITCQIYDRWRASGQGAFNALRWKTGWLDCQLLAIRRTFRISRAKLNRQWLRTEHDGQQYEIDANYCVYDPIANARTISSGLASLSELLGRFDRVMVVRVPVKQEVAHSLAREHSIIRARESIDRMWEITKQHFYGAASISFHYPDTFTLSHFHPNDSHWNANGNAHFSNWINHTLSRL